MAKHTLTVEDSAKGGRNRGKLALKLQKIMKKELGMTLDHEIILAIISQPAVISTALYLGVGLLKGNPNTASPVPKPGSGASGLSQWFNNFLNKGLLSSIGINTGIDWNVLGLDALQAALLVNIMTNGNPTGVLSSLNGTVKTGLSAIAATGA